VRSQEASNAISLSTTLLSFRYAMLDDELEELDAITEERVELVCRVEKGNQEQVAGSLRLKSHETGMTGSFQI
jgi:hypothetical protein